LYATKIVSKQRLCSNREAHYKEADKERSSHLPATPAMMANLFKGAFQNNRKDFDVGGTSPFQQPGGMLTIMAKKEQ